MKNLIKILFVSTLMLAVTFVANKLFGMTTSEGVALAGITASPTQLKNTLAEKELIKNLRHAHTWVSEIKSKQNWVNQDTIKIPKRGAAPKVLIDNTQYPILKNEREDGHVVISLHKFDTENTVVTDDEAYSLPYEKFSDVQVQHRETLEDTTAEYGLWGLAPTKNDEANNLFVLQTTGEDDGTGRKKLTSKDVRNLQSIMNKKGIDKKGRVLILTDDHVSDLLDEDRKFFTQYQNHKEGSISGNYYGFITYEDSTTPEYDDTTLEKLPYGSLTTGRKSSVVFHKATTVKAAGSVKRYLKLSDDDNELRESSVGFRLWHIIVSYGVEGSAAIISGKA